MLEIIAVIILSKNNGKLAVTKGLKSGTWILYTVLAWIAGEFIGAVAGILIFGEENIISAYILAIAGAITSYFIIKNILQKKPDTFDDDINRIGVNDLYPEKK